MSVHEYAKVLFQFCPDIKLIEIFSLMGTPKINVRRNWGSVTNPMFSIFNIKTYGCTSLVLRQPNEVVKDTLQ